MKFKLIRKSLLLLLVASLCFSPCVASTLSAPSNESDFQQAAIPVITAPENATPEQVTQPNSLPKMALRSMAILL